MDYKPGDRVRVRLYSGQIVMASITAIVPQSAGRKIHIVYGNVTVIINPAQIIEILE
jgi:2-keto-4-pentenoate hydratase